MSTAKWVTALVVVLLVGVGVGSAGAGEPETVTKEVPGPVEIKTVTETKEVATVPAECIAALDTAEEALGVAGEGLSIGGEFIALLPRTLEAGMNYDVAAVQQITAEADAKTRRMKGLTRRSEALSAQYTSASSVCRASR
jgi:hypothetical protein